MMFLLVYLCFQKTQVPLGNIIPFGFVCCVCYKTLLLLLTFSAQYVVRTDSLTMSLHLQSSFL